MMAPGEFVINSLITRTDGGDLSGDELCAGWGWRVRGRPPETQANVAASTCRRRGYGGRIGWSLQPVHVSSRLAMGIKKDSASSAWQALRRPSAADPNALTTGPKSICSDNVPGRLVTRQTGMASACWLTHASPRRESASRLRETWPSSKKTQAPVTAALCAAFERPHTSWG